MLRNMRRTFTSLPSSSFLPHMTSSTSSRHSVVSTCNLPIDDTKPAGEMCATFTYSADTGDCEHLDTSTMNDFWKKRCGFANLPTSQIFINTDIRNKYSFDPGAGAASYSLARNVAKIDDLAEALVVTPIDEDTGMSITDYIFCASFFTPCSASCIPLNPCSSFAKNALLQANRN